MRLFLRLFFVWILSNVILCSYWSTGNIPSKRRSCSKIRVDRIRVSVSALEWMVSDGKLWTREMILMLKKHWLLLGWEGNQIEGWLGVDSWGLEFGWEGYFDASIPVLYYWLGIGWMHLCATLTHTLSWDKKCSCIYFAHKQPTPEYRLYVNDKVYHMSVNLWVTYFLSLTLSKLHHSVTLMVQKTTEKRKEWR